VSRMVNGARLRGIGLGGVVGDRTGVGVVIGQ